jgi:Domain of unknown function (DUF4062)
MANISASSTFQDMQKHRLAVRAALKRRRHSVVMLDQFPANVRTPLQKSGASIAARDAIIRLLAWRYGYVQPDHNPDQFSYVELEFRYARELKRPMFVFIVKNDVPWSTQFIDSGDQAERLQAFRAEVMRHVTVEFFTTPSDLVQRVVTAASSGEQEPKAALQDEVVC